MDASLAEPNRTTDRHMSWWSVLLLGRNGQIMLPRGKIDRESMPDGRPSTNQILLSARVAEIVAKCDRNKTSSATLDRLETNVRGHHQSHTRNSMTQRTNKDEKSTAQTHFRFLI